MTITIRFSLLYRCLTVFNTSTLPISQESQSSPRLLQQASPITASWQRIARSKGDYSYFDERHSVNCIVLFLYFSIYLLIDVVTPLKFQDTSSSFGLLLSSILSFFENSSWLLWASFSNSYKYRTAPPSRFLPIALALAIHRRVTIERLSYRHISLRTRNRKSR